MDLLSTQRHSHIHIPSLLQKRKSGERESKGLMTMADEQTEGETKFILVSSVSGRWTTKPVAQINIYWGVKDKILPSH